ncbi:MAG: hypothetical protein KI790_09170 [Cyclobacteriaceae bacterium]|nr:hypothetical protein [Cyclobacteriaceae bacterium HetDA_MAG_MS6]
MNTSSRIQQFWSWFSANHDQFLSFHETDESEKERLLDELLVALHEYNKNLFFEIGIDPEDEKKELIITAEGVVEHFSAVEELVDQAPALEEWIFIKFRQSKKGVSTQIDGKDFDPEEVIFIPLTNDSDPEAIGIHVCYPDMRDADKEMYLVGTFIMLDTVIGEKATALNIDYLDVVPTPTDIQKIEYWYLSDIQSYIDETHGSQGNID